MQYQSPTPKYGYHVPHLVVSGAAAGALLLVVGAGLLGTLTGALGVASGVGCVVVGAGILAFTVGLRRFVVRGRPALTERMIDNAPWTGTERVLDVGCGPGLALVAVAKPGGRISITDERTGKLAATLRGLGFVDVTNQWLAFPVHLLSARKSAARVA
jgi:hypothetical protein